MCQPTRATTLLLNNPSPNSWLIRTIIPSSSYVRGLPDQGRALLGLDPGHFLLGSAATWSVHISWQWQKVKSSIAALAYPCVTSAQVPLTKQVIWLIPRSKSREMHSLSTTGNSKVTWAEGVVQTGDHNVTNMKKDYKFPCLPGPGMAP